MHEDLNPRFVRVPGREFSMGSDEGADDERPAYRVYVDSDWYRADAYRVSDRRNRRGPGNGTMRIVRGGSWVTHDINQLRCAHRHKVPPDTYTYSIGFRVVYSDDGSPQTDL